MSLMLQKKEVLLGRVYSRGPVIFYTFGQINAVIILSEFKTPRPSSLSPFLILFSYMAYGFAPD